MSKSAGRGANCPGGGGSRYDRGPPGAPPSRAEGIPFRDSGFPRRHFTSSPSQRLGGLLASIRALVDTEAVVEEAWSHTLYLFVYTHRHIYIYMIDVCVYSRLIVVHSICICMYNILHINYTYVCVYIHRSMHAIHKCMATYVCRLILYIIYLSAYV